jgi:RNA polymerase sigma-70 factor (ECF subfamily)
MKLDENKLLERAKHGNERAFEGLVRLYEARVFSYAMTLLGNRQDAEEVTQDVLVKIWRTLARFRGDCSFSSWVMRITKNTATDALRARREPTVSLTAEDENGEEREMDLVDEDPASNPSAAFERDERIKLVRRAIGELPHDQREILTLRDLYGYRYEEIAHILQLEDGTVRSRLSRARQHLKKILESWNFSP